MKAMTTGNTLMLTPMGAGMATITVTGADNAGGSEAAMVMHDATVVLANLTMMVTVEPMTVEEGGMATITAKASRMIAMSDGMVKVNLSVVGDATLSAEMIEIMADSDTGTATLTSTDDDMHEPDGETITLVASGAGIDGNLSFDIMVTDKRRGPGGRHLHAVRPRGHEPRRGHVGGADGDGQRRGGGRHGDHDHGATGRARPARTTTRPIRIMIMAGETSGTTMVMAVEDNEPDSGSGLAGDADALRDGGQHADQLGQLLPLGCCGPGPAGHRAAPAGGLPGRRRLPPVSSAVAFGGCVRNSPLPPLPRRPGGEGAFFVSPRSRFRPCLGPTRSDLCLPWCDDSDGSDRTTGGNDERVCDDYNGATSGRWNGHSRYARDRRSVESRRPSESRSACRRSTTATQTAGRHVDGAGAPRGFGAIETYGPSLGSIGERIEHRHAEHIRLHGDGRNLQPHRKRHSQSLPHRREHHI